MKINLSPQVRTDALVVSKSGDALTINGVVYDFAPLTEGSTLPAEAVECEYIVGPVSRVDNEIELTLLLPITADASEAAKYPEPITLTTDGEVVLPC